MSMSWHESNLTTVWINKKVVRKLYDEAKRREPFETGGSLLGYWDDYSKQVVIEESIGPGPTAKHSRCSFKPDDRWQETQIAHIYKESGLLWSYLGDWHSHPKGILELSWRDKRTLLKIAKYAPARALHPLMVLVDGSSCQMRIWMVEKIGWLFNVVTSECEIIEYT